MIIGNLFLRKYPTHVRIETKKAANFRRFYPLFIEIAYTLCTPYKGTNGWW